MQPYIVQDVSIIIYRNNERVYTNGFKVDLQNSEEGLSHLTLTDLRLTLDIETSPKTCELTFILPTSALSIINGGFYDPKQSNILWREMDHIRIYVSSMPPFMAVETEIQNTLQGQEIFSDYTLLFSGIVTYISTSFEEGKYTVSIKAQDYLYWLEATKINSKFSLLEFFFRETLKPEEIQYLQLNTRFTGKTLKEFIERIILNINEIDFTALPETDIFSMLYAIGGNSTQTILSGEVNFVEQMRQLIANKNIKKDINAVSDELNKIIKENRLLPKIVKGDNIINNVDMFKSNYSFENVLSDVASQQTNLRSIAIYWYNQFQSIIKNNLITLYRGDDYTIVPIPWETGSNPVFSLDGTYNSRLELLNEVLESTLYEFYQAQNGWFILKPPLLNAPPSFIVDSVEIVSEDFSRSIENIKTSVITEGALVCSGGTTDLATREILIKSKIPFIQGMYNCLFPKGFIPTVDKTEGIPTLKVPFACASFYEFYKLIYGFIDAMFSALKRIIERDEYYKKLNTKTLDSKQRQEYEEKIKEIDKKINHINEFKKAKIIGKFFDSDITLLLFDMNDIFDKVYEEFMQAIKKRSDKKPNVDKYVYTELLKNFCRMYLFLFVYLNLKDFLNIYISNDKIKQQIFSNLKKSKNSLQTIVHVQNIDEIITKIIDYINNNSNLKGLWDILKDINIVFLNSMPKKINKLDLYPPFNLIAIYGYINGVYELDDDKLKYSQGEFNIMEHGYKPLKITNRLVRTPEQAITFSKYKLFLENASVDTVTLKLKTLRSDIIPGFVLLNKLDMCLYYVKSVSYQISAGSDVSTTLTLIARRKPIWYDPAYGYSFETENLLKLCADPVKYRKDNNLEGIFTHEEAQQLGVNNLQILGWELYGPTDSIVANDPNFSGVFLPPFGGALYSQMSTEDILKLLNRFDINKGLNKELNKKLNFVDGVLLIRYINGYYYMYLPKEFNLNKKMENKEYELDWINPYKDIIEADPYAFVKFEYILLQIINNGLGSLKFPNGIILVEGLTYESNKGEIKNDNLSFSLVSVEIKYKYNVNIAQYMFNKFGPDVQLKILNAYNRGIEYLKRKKVKINFMSEEKEVFYLSSV